MRKELKMLIKWRSIWWPSGEWRDENDKKVNLTGNFMCKINTEWHICVMADKTSAAGHGDPSVTSDVPMFINNHTLKEVKFDGFIFVDDEVIKNGQM